MRAHTPTEPRSTREGLGGREGHEALHAPRSPAWLYWTRAPAFVVSLPGVRPHLRTILINSYARTLRVPVPRRHWTWFYLQLQLVFLVVKARRHKPVAARHAWPTGGSTAWRELPA